jgi:hypothetical protein
MFQTLTTCLTLAAFVAHGLLGCCWHHEHCTAAIDSSAAPAMESHPVHACCGHHGARDQENSPADVPHDGRHSDSDSPCPSECDEGHCVFARATYQGNELTGASTTGACLLPANEAPVLNPAAAANLRVTALDEPAFLFSAPLRARLQIWLI